MDKEYLMKGVIFLTDHLHRSSETEKAFPAWSDEDIFISEGRDYASLGADIARLHLYRGRSDKFIQQREYHFAKEGVAVIGTGRLVGDLSFILTEEDES